MKRGRRSGKNMQVVIDDGRQQNEDAVDLPQLTIDRKSYGSEELPGPHVQRVLPTANRSDGKSQPEPPQCLAELAPVLGCGSLCTSLGTLASC